MRRCSSMRETVIIRSGRKCLAGKRGKLGNGTKLVPFCIHRIDKRQRSGDGKMCIRDRSHPHYQITGFSRSSGRGISYYGWEAKFILRSSKSHPLRQRAPLCTHSSFPETFVTALTLRSGKNAHTTRLQQFFTYPAEDVYKRQLRGAPDR